MTTSMSRSTLPPSVDDMWTSSNGKDLKQVRLVLHVATTWDWALLRVGGGVSVGYINNLNYAPLIKRDELWKGSKIDNNWAQVFFVEDAANFRGEHPEISH